MISKQYNILSLDGGGSWALIQVMCLQELYGEHTRGRVVLSKFDLVAGNSGGSLVLAALAENLMLSEILKLFKDEVTRKQIFSRHFSFLRPFYKLTGLGPRYGTEKKLRAIEALLPTISKISIFDLPNKLRDSTGKETHFFIPAFDFNRKRAVFFRSDSRSNGIASNLASQLGIEGRGDSPLVTLCEAAHASSTAPVNYFKRPATLKNCDSSYWDGAIAGYNNPILAATTEAIINGINPEDIFVFSIGSGTTVLPVGESNHSFFNENLKLVLKKRGRLFRDVKKLATSILAAPPDAATYIAFTFLYPNHAGGGSCQNKRFIRANPQLQPIFSKSKWHLPLGLTLSEFTRLIDLDMDATNQCDVDLIIKFCTGWLENNVPNQPIRLDSDLKCLIGQPSFYKIKELIGTYLA